MIFNSHTPIKIAKMLSEQKYVLLIIQYTALLQYDWPGTMIGCDCSTNTNLHNINETKFSIDQFFNKYFMKGRVCSTDMKTQNCKTVNEEFSKTFTSWNDGTFGKRILYKYILSLCYLHKKIKEH